MCLLDIATCGGRFLGRSQCGAHLCYRKVLISAVDTHNSGWLGICKGRCANADSGLSPPEDICLSITAGFWSGKYENTRSAHGDYLAAVGCLHSGRTRAKARDGNLVLVEHGAPKLLPPDAFPVMPVWDAAGVPSQNLFFCGVGKGSGKPYGMAAGLYLFNDSGDAAGFIPTDAAEFCSEVRLSPGNSVLAMDSGTWLVRSWFFYTYPGLKGLGRVEYYQAEEKPGLLWNKDGGVLFSSMSHDPHHRQCDYDPCGPVSVSTYSFKNRNVKTLLQGTDLCDFTLSDSAPDSGAFVAEKLCLPSSAAWRAFPVNASVESIFVNPGTSNR